MVKCTCTFLEYINLFGLLFKILSLYKYDKTIAQHFVYCDICISKEEIKYNDRKKSLYKSKCFRSEHEYEVTGVVEFFDVKT